MSMVLTIVDHLNQANAEATDSERCAIKTEETAGTGTTNEEGANAFATSGEISIGSVSLSNDNVDVGSRMAFGIGEANFNDSVSITVTSGNAHQQAGSIDMASSSIQRRVIIPRRSKRVLKGLCTKEIGEGSVFVQNGGGHNIEKVKELASTAESIIPEDAGSSDRVRTAAQVKRTKTLKELTDDITKGLNNIKASWTNITGQGHNDYSDSRKKSQAKRRGRTSSDIPVWLSPRKSRSSMMPRKKRNINLRTPPRPAPHDGLQYRPTSAAKIVLRTHPDFQSKVMKDIMKKEQIPVKIRAFQRVVKNGRMGKFQPEWNLRGFPTPTDEDIVSGPKELTGGCSKVGMTKDNVSTVLKKLGGGREYSDITLRRYQRHFQGQFEGTKSVVYRKITRVQADQSLKAAACLLHTIASTHYRINDKAGAKEDPRYAAASDDTKYLYDRVSSFHANGDGRVPLKAVHSHMNLSSDDSAIFACLHSSATGNDWFLLMDDDDGMSGYYSYYTLEGEKKEAPAGGFRPGLVIRLTWTITASGILFPLFCQVLHLNERELPKDKCPSGILIVEFEGLSVGAAADRRNREVGYVCFVRQGVNESDIFNAYIKQVYLPHIEFLRKGLDHIAKDDLFYVSWLDGAQPQMEKHN